MTTSALNYNLISCENSAPGTNLLATVKLLPERFVQSHQVNFVYSYDDLDSLIFANFSLPSGNLVSLVRHQNAPYSGTELYLSANLPNPSDVLIEALDALNISEKDLDWIHPQISLNPNGIRES